METTASEELVIVAAGARTPLGLSAPSAAAAVRAGICQLQSHPHMIDRQGEPVIVARDPLLEPTLPCWKRMAEMAADSILQILDTQADLLAREASLPVLIGLPEFRPGWTATEEGLLGHELEQALEGATTLRLGIKLRSQGHAAGIAAFEEAAGLLRSGEASFCLAGGVDSYIDADAIDWLQDHRQLLTTADGRKGFHPGEAAGFCLLTTKTLAEGLSLTPLATVRGLGTAQEPHTIKSDGVCSGQGLMEAMKKALEPVPDLQGSLRTVFCDLNGERYRNDELAYAHLRFSRAFHDDYELLHPADCWGDLGAATSPLLSVVATQAGLQGWSPEPRYLVVGSSEGGLRGAMVLDLTEGAAPWA